MSNLEKYKEELKFKEELIKAKVRLVKLEKEYLTNKTEYIVCSKEYNKLVLANNSEILKETKWKWDISSGLEAINPEVFNDIKDIFYIDDETLAFCNKGLKKIDGLLIDDTVMLYLYLADNLALLDVKQRNLKSKELELITIIKKYGLKIYYDG